MAGRIANTSSKPTTLLEDTMKILQKKTEDEEDTTKSQSHVAEQDDETTASAADTAPAATGDEEQPDELKNAVSKIAEDVLKTAMGRLKSKGGTPTPIQAPASGDLDKENQEGDKNPVTEEDEQDERPTKVQEDDSSGDSGGETPIAQRTLSVTTNGKGMFKFKGAKGIEIEIDPDADEDKDTLPARGKRVKGKGNWKGLTSKGRGSDGSELPVSEEAGDGDPNPPTPGDTKDVDKKTASELDEEDNPTKAVDTIEGEGDADSVEPAKELGEKQRKSQGEGENKMDLLVPPPVVAESTDISTDLRAMFHGEKLSSEFKQKITTIFEAAVAHKAAILNEAWQTHAQKAIRLVTEEIVSKMAVGVDRYLEYIAEEWMKEHQPAVDNQLKLTLYESFFGGLKTLMEQHNVQMPEEKVDVIASLQSKITTLQTQLNEEVQKNIEARAELCESAKAQIVAREAKNRNLSNKQIEKLVGLAESLTFEDADTFESKITTLCESYFNPQTRPSKKPKLTTEPDGSGELLAEDTSSAMSRYTSALKRTHF